MPPLNTNPSHWSRFRGWIFLLVILVLLVIGMYLYSTFSGPQKSAARFATQITSGELANAYENTGSTFKEVYDREDFQTVLDAAINGRTVKKVAFRGKEMNGAMATMNGVWIFDDGNEEAFVMYLSQNADDDWIVTGMEFKKNETTACGGIAGIGCPSGYRCEIADTVIADAMGVCVKE
ncbi:MAG: hypothetical protein HYZ08_01515 [Candidatus Kerfeldbacteria bacterium]|nr:hypothetical protein [Candidatus Kerfeldbacteria bacterium]